MHKAISTSLFALLFLFSTFATAATNSGTSGLSLDGTGVYMTSSTQQGGQGPQGSTVLTQIDFLYHLTWFSFGVAFQYDIEGSSEKDVSLGPKIEFGYMPFFLELAYLPYMNKGFTDRSIAAQKGYAIYFGLGVRYLLSDPDGAHKGIYLEAAYKYRIQKINNQDGVSLSQTITQTDGYPLIGFGYQF